MNHEDRAFYQSGLSLVRAHEKGAWAKVLYNEHYGINIYTSSKGYELGNRPLPEESSEGLFVRTCTKALERIRKGQSEVDALRAEVALSYGGLDGVPAGNLERLGGREAVEAALAWKP